MTIYKSGRGFGSRFDKFTPNAIDRATQTMPGLGYGESLSKKTLMCIKCQKDKPRLGGKFVSKLFKCADCCAEKVSA